MKETSEETKGAQVLDHGYVRLVDSWGSEEGIIEAARMSTQKGFEGWGPFCSKCGVRVVVDFAGDVSAADYEHDDEIREYARAVASFLDEKFPRTMSLFQEGRGS